MEMLNIAFLLFRIKQSFLNVRQSIFYKNVSNLPRSAMDIPLHRCYNTDRVLQLKSI